MQFGLIRSDRPHTGTDWVEIGLIEGKVGVSFYEPIDFQCEAVDGQRAALTRSIRFNDLNLANWFSNWCNEKYNRRGCFYTVVECQ